jgi:hypothetical protein
MNSAEAYFLVAILSLDLYNINFAHECSDKMKLEACECEYIIWSIITMIFLMDITITERYLHLFTKLGQ